MTETGSLEPGKIGGYKRSAIDTHAATLRAALQDRPDMTLAALCGLLRSRHGLTVSLTAMHAALHRLGLRPPKACRRRRARRA